MELGGQAVAAASAIVVDVVVLTESVEKESSREISDFLLRGYL